MDYTASRALVDIIIIYGVVVVVSFLVAVVIRLIVWALSRQASRSESAAAAKPQLVPKPLAAATGVPAEHVAAIAAAVMAMTGAHRIVRIEPKVPSYGWTAVTRATHQTSHSPRRGR